jgi:hypothetical protein
MLPGLIACPGNYAVERCAALPAKTTGRSVEVAASFTLNSESGSASFAIFIGRLILATATQTLHHWPLEERSGRHRPQKVAKINTLIMSMGED